MDITTYLTDLRARQAKAWPAQIPRQLTYPLGEVSIPEHLRNQAAAHPDRAALIFYGREVTFRELDDLSDRVASWLIDRGVGRGDRVAVMLPNCPQFVVVMMASLKLGAVHVPVNPMFRSTELQHELADSGAVALICQPESREMVESVRDGLPLRAVAVVSVADMLPTSPSFPVPSSVANADPTSEWASLIAGAPVVLPAPDIDALAALNYTGGTTGLPKGCEHTQRHMLYTAVCVRSANPKYTNETHVVGLAFTPIFWIGGENSLISMAVYGSTLVLLTRWDPLAVLQAIQEYRVMEFGGTVDNYVELMGRTDFESFDLSSLISPRAMSFVRKLTPEIRRRWRNLVGDHSILREAAYGMTETHTMDTSTWGFAHQDHDLKTTPVFCGLPMPGTEYIVVDEHTKQPLPLGDAGAILIRTPSLTTGYWNAPDATKNAIVDGWLDTGDKGMIDEDGCLHYLGRDKDMIKVNGMSVFPSEIESILAQHPQIESSAVVAMPDPHRGQVPLAFVRINEGAPTDETALTAWARDNMSVFKVPLFHFVTEFPMTVTGKIRKVELAAQAAQMGGTDDSLAPHVAGGQPG